MGSPSRFASDTFVVAAVVSEVVVDRNFAVVVEREIRYDRILMRKIVKGMLRGFQGEQNLKEWKGKN